MAAAVLGVSPGGVLGETTIVPAVPPQKWATGTSKLRPCLASEQSAVHLAACLEKEEAHPGQKKRSQKEAPVRLTLEVVRELQLNQEPGPLLSSTVHDELRTATARTGVVSETEACPLLPLALP